MPSFGHGYQRGIETAIGGFIAGIVIRSILQAFNYEEFIVIFALINGLLIIILFNNIKYWGIGYTIGWIFGIMIFYMIVPWWEFAIYITFFIIAIVIKFRNKFSNYY